MSNLKKVNDIEKSKYIFILKQKSQEPKKRHPLHLKKRKFGSLIN